MRMVGVSPDKRILKNHRQPIAAQLVQLRARQVEDFLVAITHRAAGLPVRRQQAEHGQEALGFPGTRIRRPRPGSRRR